MPLDNKIKQFRQSQGLTQEELAASLGVSRQTIVAMEKGNYTPSLLLGLQLAALFKVKVEDLFSAQ
jgi:putative transcriptional regulator